jgi:AAA15 family ATPase/GTPase
VPVFLREKQNIIKISKTHLPKGYEISKMKNKLLTEKILFLRLIASFEDKLAETLLKNILSISVYTGYPLDVIVEDYLKNKNNATEIANFLQLMDTGIDAIILANVKSENYNKEKTVILSSHKRYNECMEEIEPILTFFDDVESEGTKQMLGISPFIFSALKKGAPIIIDEFGSQFHPLLAKEIISLFNSAKNNKSQIIVATHTTELMSSDLLRKDQIDFVEKDVYGRSYLYTLVEIKGIRNTTSFENDYFKGKYGAIPFLGNRDELEKICNETNETVEQ